MKKLSKHIHNEIEMMEFASSLAKGIDGGCYIYLHGLLGAGKTTFTRGLLRGLGYHDKVKSPTYTLVEPYEIKNRSVFHFDLYRLNDAEELIEIGVQEYFSSDAICVVEWSEKGKPLLPKPDIDCHITFLHNEREITLESLTARGDKVLNNIFA